MKLVVKHPLSTEKSQKLMELGVYVFAVAKDATKIEIKKNIETMFETKVKSVNILKKPNKNRTFRGKKGVKTGFKKAYVKIASGQKINFTELKISQHD